MSPVAKKSDGRIRLGIQIDKQGFLFAQCNGGSKINGSGGLAHAALLIGNGQDCGHKRPGLPIAGAKPPREAADRLTLRGGFPALRVRTIYSRG